VPTGTQPGSPVKEHDPGGIVIVNRNKTREHCQQDTSRESQKEQNQGTLSTKSEQASRSTTREQCEQEHKQQALSNGALLKVAQPETVKAAQLH
jgi:hypothetical protein